MAKASLDPRKLPAAAGEALSRFSGAVRGIGNWLALPGLSRAAVTGGPTRAEPGTPPGIESLVDTDSPPAPGSFRVECIDYGPDRTERRVVDDLDTFLAEPRPAWARNRWINVDGLHPWIINRLRQHFGFHTLAAEDAVRAPQRPKLEAYPDHLFLVVRMIRLGETSLVDEQVSLFLWPDTVLTVQELEGDVFNPIRERIRRPGSRLRTLDASYLAYALLDAMVDHCFPILEHYGERLEELESLVLERPTTDVQHRIHRMKRELTVLRRVMWPMREVTAALYRDESGRIPEVVRAYFRDVHDHSVQVMDIVETHREMAAGLNDLFMSAVSNRMNEVMKVLTLMASFFIPITFVAGVYGMNFERIPELGWSHGYATFWVVCGVITAGLAAYFWRRGWIGRG